MLPGATPGRVARALGTFPRAPRVLLGGHRRLLGLRKLALEPLFGFSQNLIFALLHLHHTKLMCSFGENLLAKSALGFLVLNELDGLARLHAALVVIAGGAVDLTVRGSVWQTLRAALGNELTPIGSGRGNKLRHV